MATIITTGWTNLHLLMTGNAPAMVSALKKSKRFLFLCGYWVAGVAGRN